MMTTHSLVRVVTYEKPLPVTLHVDEFDMHGHSTGYGTRCVVDRGRNCTVCSLYLEREMEDWLETGCTACTWT